MTKLQAWVKLPTAWIEAQGLQQFRWLKGMGANNLAALMALTVIAHHIDPENGIARLTYDDLCEKTTLSRAKVAEGLDLLSDRQIVDREPCGRSTYHLANYDPTLGWAQFPASGLYRNGAVSAFSSFHLRLQSELDAMKLYFLFASRRDRNSNSANISYEKIEEYSGVSRNNIRKALSVLAGNGLVHIDRTSSDINEFAVSNAYRLAHLNTRTHRGTSGRRAKSTDFVDMD